MLRAIASPKDPSLQKRKQVLNCLLESDKALSAYELADYCREKFSSQLPAMSVYRILDFLEKAGLVHRLESAQKYVACSHIAENQEHELSQFLICQSCYHVEEISIGKSFMSTLKQSAENVGFKLTKQELELNSLCGVAVSNQLTSAKAQKSSFFLDGAAIGLSALCAIHCLMLPVALTLLPVIATLPW